MTAREIVVRTRREQGLEAKVTDAGTLRKLAALVAVDRQKGRRKRRDAT